MEGGKGKTKVAAGYAVKRSYGYDRTGNLTHSTDQRTGTTHFEYDKLGRITQAGNEVFAFDPAHNILSDGRATITDNRLKTYNGASYYSGLTLNQYGVASPCLTICTVCGFVALS